MKTRISAPAHPSATGIGRVSGLVNFCIHPFIISLHHAYIFLADDCCSYPVTVNSADSNPIAGESTSLWPVTTPAALESPIQSEDTPAPRRLSVTSPAPRRLSASTAPPRRTSVSPRLSESTDGEVEHTQGEEESM